MPNSQIYSSMFVQVQAHKVNIALKQKDANAQIAISNLAQ